MRVSYSFALRDQNRLVYMDDDKFVASLPEDVRPSMQRHFDRFGMDLNDFKSLFETPALISSGPNRPEIVF